jgi:hypothetical protein
MVGSKNTHIVEKNLPTPSARANFKFFYKSKNTNKSVFLVSTTLLQRYFYVHCTYRFSTRECSFSPIFYLNVNTLDREREREREL